MNVVRIPMLVSVSVALITLASIPAFSQSFDVKERPPHLGITCSANNTVIGVDETSRSPEGETYFVDDFRDDRILFVEEMFFRKPPVLSKIEYATSCLSIISGTKFKFSDDSERLCEAISFLSRADAFDRNEIVQLEELSYSGGASLYQFDFLSLRDALECLYWR